MDSGTRTVLMFLAVFVTITVCAVMAAYAATYQVQRSYNISITIQVFEVGTVPARRFNYTMGISIPIYEVNAVVARRFNYTMMISIPIYEVNAVPARRVTYIVYTTVRLTINLTRGGVTTTVYDSEVSTGAILRLYISYSGFVCTNRLDGYAVVFANRTGLPVASLYLPSSDAFTIPLARGEVYIVSLPRSGRCAAGSCVANFTRAYVGGSITTNNTIYVTMTTDITITAVYEVEPVAPCNQPLIAVPHRAVWVGRCPEGAGTCYWFENSGRLAISISCTYIGDIIMVVYEFQHNETFRVLLGDRLLLELPPTGSYKVRSLRIKDQCPVCYVALQPTCHMVHISAQMLPGVTATGPVIPVPTITVPGVGLSAPEIASPSGLVMFGSLVGLFLFMSKKTRWPHAMFTVSVILAVGGMVVFQSPQIFVVGILMALVAIVLDRYV